MHIRQYATMYPPICDLLAGFIHNYRRVRDRIRTRHAAGQTDVRFGTDNAMSRAETVSLSVRKSVDGVEPHTSPQETFDGCSIYS